MWYSRMASSVLMQTEPNQPLLLSYRDERPTQKRSPLFGSAVANAAMTFAVGFMWTCPTPPAWDYPGSLQRLGALMIGLPVLLVFAVMALTHPRLKGTLPGLLVGLLAGVVGNFALGW